MTYIYHYCYVYHDGRSLVATNSHLLQELEESKQRHFEEITQMNLNYENLRNTIDTYSTS